MSARAAMADPAIDIRGIVKTFQTGRRSVAALNQLSAGVPAKQVTGLVGPDGAGKTTLMRLIAGILRPDEGAISVFGMDSVAETAEIQANIGYMPQRFGLYEDLSVTENLDLYADLHGLLGDQRRRRFDELMEFTGLGPFCRRQAGRLSGGMKQKLGLACTLVSQPRLLLLDEPSVGVDPVSRRDLWDIVYALAGEGMSVLWSTAYLDEAARCQEVILINQGRLLDSGAPAKFSERLSGRTYEIRIDRGDRRELLRSAQALPGVLDANIKGQSLRLLLAQGVEPSVLDGLAESRAAQQSAVREVEPTFEDAFITLLREPAAPGETPSLESAPVPAPEQGAASTPSPAGAETSPVIEIANLSRDFGAFRAVDRISFQISRGEIFGLLGPNGAGKSTTFKMLCGLLPPSEGQAKVLGIDLRRAAPVARSRIGYMAQKFSLYGDMSVLQNLRFFASAYGLSGSLQRSRIDWVLEEFGLERYGAVNSRDLPLGYKQRLALACAIMHEPGVLFLDEPTSGVDPLVRRSFWSRINAMAAAGVTVMVTTHFMDEAEYCDRAGIIYQGRLIALGSPQDLRREHASAKRPDPTLEEAFVDLIEAHNQEVPQ